MSDAPLAGQPDSLYRYRFAPAEFDELAMTLTVAGQAVAAEPRPLRVLAMLLHHANEVVTKDELHDAVWDGRETVDNVLANAITKLRKALGGEAGARIVNVPRVGYRLTGPVERMAVSVSPPAAQHFSAGQAVPGRPGFVLVEPLGAPGRNAVWLVRQTKTGTERVIKFADTASALRVLKREFTLSRVLRQSLGDCAGLAPVLDTNFAEPPYFLEMDHVGPDLLRWADTNPRWLSMTRGERIELFLQVARTLALAHGVGVLHKDVKPSNVLVRERGAGIELVLADFGSGEVLDPERLRQLGVTALGLTVSDVLASSSAEGTLMYTAPELLAGQSPTVSSDVYALGLLLYQMLVGDLRRPLSTGWQREIDDALLCEDVAAATEGDPAARLPAVADLVQRLSSLEQRRAASVASANQQAQLARQAEQLARSRARRPWVAAALTALAVGLGLSLWQYREARIAWRSSEEALKSSRATLEFLTDDVLTTPDLGRSGADKPKPLLELARQGAAQVGERFAGLPFQEAASRHHLARTFQRLSAHTDGLRQFELAISLLTPLVSADDERLLTLQLEHALLLFTSGDSNHPTGQQLVARARQAAGPERLARPGPLAVLAARAQVGALSTSGRDTQAVQAARDLVKLADRADTPDLIDRIEARRVLAEALLSDQNIAEFARVSAELDRAPLNVSPDSALAHAHLQIRYADMLREGGKPEAAQPVLREVLQRLTGAKRPSLWHIGYAHSELGHTYARMRQADKAAEQYRAALDALRSALGDEHPFVLVTAVHLAERYLTLGRPQETLSLCQATHAWAAVSATGGQYDPRNWVCARAWVALRQPAQALKYLEDLPKPGPDDLPHGLGTEPWLFQAAKGWALEQLGREAEGRRLLVEAKQMLARFGRLPATDSPWGARLAQIE